MTGSKYWTHRWLAALLACALCCQPGSRAAPAATPQNTVSVSARDLAMAIADAYGGLSRVKEIKDGGFRSRGRFTTFSGISGASNSFDCQITGKGDKVRIDTELIGQKMTLAFNGKTSWTQVGDWVSPSSETTAKRIVEELRHGLNLLADIDRPDCKMEYAGRHLINGKECLALKITADDGKPTMFFADSKSKLVTRSEFMGTDHEQGTEALQAVEYLDYRPVAGSQTAFKTIEYTGGKKTSETVLTEIALAQTVEDSTFEMPPEKEIERLKAGPVTVPFEFTGNEILVTVRLNNKTDQKFILDTGASQTVIDKSTASSLGPVSTGNYSITAGAKAVPLNYATLDSLTIGDVTVDRVPALVTDLSSFARAIGEKPAGLLGANVLKRFLVTIDFPLSVIVLSDPRKVSVPADAVVVPTAPSFGATALVVSGTIDKKTTVNFLVDTGAAFSNLPQSAAHKLYSGPILPVGQVFGIDGQKLSIGSLRVKSFKAGGLTVANPVFALTPDGAVTSGLFSAGSMGILGNTLWKDYRMTIDYRNERLLLQQTEAEKLLAEISGKINATARALLTHRDYKLALSDYGRLAEQARARKATAAEALALAAMAGTRLSIYKAGSDRAQLSQAMADLEKAQALAAQSRNKQVQGRIYAESANFYLRSGSDPSYAATIQALIFKAVAAAPAEPAAYCLLGELALKGGKTALARQLFDQTLMLDPSNWQALWARYRMASAGEDAKHRTAVINQLRFYYSDTAEVIALLKPARPPHPARTAGRGGARGR